jgi:hypothetical protein
MFTLRCTARLLKQLAVKPAPSAQTPTTRLGDWYATILWGRPRVLLCVSERTLLPVLVRLPSIGELLPALRDSVAAVLTGLRVPAGLVDDEIAEMETAVIDRTANRRVLGSMIDFGYAADIRRYEDISLTAISLWLTETPCGPLGMDSPERVVGEMFASSAGVCQ